MKGGVTIFEKLLALDEKKRNSIIQAGLNEFARKGYDNASTNVIAKEAGISKALMFHYIHNKNDFFYFLYDYAYNYIVKNYLSKIDYTEKDIIERLRKTSKLKFKVISLYPLIYDFIKSAIYTNSFVVKDVMEAKKKIAVLESATKFFEIIDQSKFKEGLDPEKCAQLITLTVYGFANQIMELFENGIEKFALNKVEKDFDNLLDDLKKVYYK